MSLFLRLSDIQTSKHPAKRKSKGSSFDKYSSIILFTSSRTCWSYSDVLYRLSIQRRVVVKRPLWHLPKMMSVLFGETENSSSLRVNSEILIDNGMFWIFILDNVFFLLPYSLECYWAHRKNGWFLYSLLIRVHLFHKTLTNSLLKQCLDDNIETNELNMYKY